MMLLYNMQLLTLIYLYKFYLIKDNNLIMWRHATHLKFNIESSYNDESNRTNVKLFFNFMMINVIYTTGSI